MMDGEDSLKQDFNSSTWTTVRSFTHRAVGCGHSRATKGEKNVISLLIEDSLLQSLVISFVGVSPPLACNDFTWKAGQFCDLGYQVGHSHLLWR
mmetsp:Transcript_7087/g.16233  ORF Transcript_7087/g.16233 Transcript_7087/m.16233 type:complete len:94 (-) Transcript_7087:1086-1367(-)